MSAAVCLATSRMRADDPAANLIPNPGFEAIGASAKAPLHWALQDGFTLSEGDAKSGKYCLCYSSRDSAAKMPMAATSLRLAPGKRYRVSAWIRTRDFKGGKKGATVRLEWKDRYGKYLGELMPFGVGGVPAYSLPADKPGWQLLSLVTPPIPADTASSGFACVVSPKSTGEAFWDDVSVTLYQGALVADVITDHYRDEAIGGKIVVRSRLYLDDYNLPPDKASVSLKIIDAAGKSIQEVAGRVLNKQLAEMAFSAESLPPGTYGLPCDVRSTDGTRSGRARGKFNRLAALPSRRTYIDEHQRLIVDGKPFFPLGLYARDLNAADLELWRDSPLNCVMPYQEPTRAQLDAAERQGMKVIYSLAAFWHPVRKQRKNWLAEIHSATEETATLTMQVRAMADHPAVLAWYLFDEIRATDAWRPRLQQRQQVMQSLDPNHPTWGVVIPGTANFSDYLGTADAVGVDPYPIPHGPLDMVGHETRRAFDATLGGLRPVWMVPQIFNWANFPRAASSKGGELRPPTFDEIRNMAWQSIAAGANGLVFFTYEDLHAAQRRQKKGAPARADSESFAVRWNVVKKVAAEIRQCREILLATGAVDLPTCQAAGASLFWRCYAYDNKTYLLVVNADDKRATDAVFTFPTEYSAVEQLLGPNKGLREDGRITNVHLQPMEVLLIGLRPKK
jgi:hypothetical protein